jgi:uncharacterized membrane protein required for colicin V production
MNNLDYALAALIGFCALYGLGRGVLRIATSILSLVLGTAAAATWYAIPAAFLQQRWHLAPTLADALGYVIIFIAVAIVVEFSGRRIILLVQAINLNWFDRLGGILLGAILGAALAGIVVVVLTAAMPAGWPPLAASRVAPRVLAFDSALLAYVPPDAVSLFERKRDELAHYWADQKESPAPTPIRSAGGT